MRSLMRVVAAWAGVNALFFLALLIYAASSGRMSITSGVDLLASLALLGLACLGLIACARLWSLTLGGRNSALIFFGVLTLAYLVKLVIGPERIAILWPLGLSVSAISVLMSPRPGEVWLTEATDRAESTEQH